jgi:hypothetical protein
MGTENFINYPPDLLLENSLELDAIFECQKLTINKIILSHSFIVSKPLSEIKTV